MEQQSVRAIAGYSPFTVKLIVVLEKGAIGDVKSDDELARITGVPVSRGTAGYGYLASAIRHCERLGVIWQRERGQGRILCQNAGEVLRRTCGDMGRIKRLSARASRRLAYVDTKDFSESDRPKAFAVAAQIGAIALMSRSEKTKMLIKGSQGGPLQIGDAMKMFDK